MHDVKGDLDGHGMRIAVVVSRFNGVVTERLLSGALQALREHGVDDDAIEVVHVPGAFELPLPIELLASAGRVDGVVCLGAVVRGETPHFEYISATVFDAIGSLMIRHQLPIALGVLTTETVEQALERSGGRHGNKGRDAALTAIEMVSVRRALSR
jgi:6,7-dimethyl-8-ribityllumazine synthase